MGSERNQKTDHLLATALAVGGLCAFSLVLLGSALLLTHNRYASPVLRAGMLVLMSTPVLRVALAVFAFMRERDWKYAAIAFAVLMIVLLGATLRVAV